MVEVSTYGIIKSHEVAAPMKMGARDNDGVQKYTTRQRRQRTMVTGRFFDYWFFDYFYQYQCLSSINMAIKPQLQRSLKGMFASAFMFPYAVQTT